MCTADQRPADAPRRDRPLKRAARSRRRP
jgi:hypothetical protein